MIRYDAMISSVLRLSHLKRECKNNNDQNVSFQQIVYTDLKVTIKVQDRNLTELYNKSH